MDGTLDSPSIRPAVPADAEALLALNAEWEHVTSPLHEESLGALLRQSAYHRVVENGAGLVAFLLALGPGVDYSSPNYRWFEVNSSDFLYIDRVLVSSSHQRTGFGAMLYEDLLAYAGTSGILRLTCEVDADPPNAASHAFHSRFGFVEVGLQRLPGGKLVSLRERMVETPGPHEG